MHIPITSELAKDFWLSLLDGSFQKWHYGKKQSSVSTCQKIRKQKGMVAWNLLSEHANSLGSNFKEVELHIIEPLLNYFDDEVFRNDHVFMAIEQEFISNLFQQLTRPGSNSFRAFLQWFETALEKPKAFRKLTEDGRSRPISVKEARRQLSRGILHALTT